MNKWLLAALLSLTVGTMLSPTRSAPAIKVFAGSAVKPPLEEIASLYEKQTGMKVELTFGGSGTMLAQMILARQGDVYVPGSDDFMDKAEAKGAVHKGKRRLVAYLIPTICVQKGNPRHIQTLQDLTRPGIRVGVGAPGAVCLGDIAVEVFKEAGLTEKVKPNIVTHANSCEQVAAILRMKQVDAVIGWDVFSAWAPSDIQTIPLPAKLRKFRYVPAAVTRYATDPRAAGRFVQFLCSATGKSVFKKHGYIVTLTQGQLKHEPR